ncbi:MAG: formate dehydrogenase subunit delta [Alphaproteobacteria bacterium]|jgi:formate dehydrogenase subunit delta|nr:formate dehydrogenase subunit delta [Paracoccaceae bacterium]
MTHSPTEKLVQMANQIATFFDTQPGDPADGIAKHINEFWEPRMREGLLTHANTTTADLSPSVIKALPRIRRAPQAA